MAWVAGPVLAFAVAKGRFAAAGAAVILGAVDGVIRGFTTEVMFNGLALLLLAGLVFGYLTAIAAAAEGRMHEAVELEAANRERERLARTIHDSVLQALALIARRGRELGGEAAELGRLAGEQGAVLRTLVGVGGVEPAATGDVDLRAVLSRHESAEVSVAVPATPVVLGAHAANEVDAAVAAALDNVTAHAGTGGRAVVLIEDEDDTVTVTVRDEGLGMSAHRLAEAAAAGRLGVAQSIRGRIRDLGGAVAITSAPRAGTEVEMRIPRSLVSA
jgi:signal transduction histidine kinase